MTNNKEREFEKIARETYTNCKTHPDDLHVVSENILIKQIANALNEAYAKGRQSVLGDKIKNLDIEVLDKRIELSKKYGEQCEGATFDFYMWILSKLSDDKGG